MELISSVSIILELWGGSSVIKIKHLVDALKQLRFIVEATCGRFIYHSRHSERRFGFYILNKLSTPIATELKAALRRLILGRRAEYSSLLQHLIYTPGS